jgi:hypothetical protein
MPEGIPLQAATSRPGAARAALGRQKKTSPALALACFGCLFAAADARAQALSNNNYAIDQFTGPVYGAGRILGMGGAHAAIAAGIDGAAFNPACYAERAEKEIRFWEVDPTGGIWAGGVFSRNDLDNNGTRGLESAQAVQLSLGMRLQLSSFGMGSLGQLRQYTLRDGNGDAYASVRLMTARYGIGYAFLNGSLVVGAALVQTSMDISSSQGTSDLVPSAFNTTSTGGSIVRFRSFGGEVGVLVRPAYQRYRVGASFHTPSTSRPLESAPDADGIRRAEGLVLPESVHVPWELSMGMAYQFGERRTNVPWRNTRALKRELSRQIAERTYVYPEEYGEAPYETLPDDKEKALEVALEIEKEAQRRLRRHQPRRYVLLAADMLIYGQTDGGQSLNAFLLQRSEQSGRRFAMGARVGVESEVLHDRMRLRAGTYVEPSRTQLRYYRPHITTGIDVRLFDFWRWSARGTFTTDIAPRYFNWALAFGLWW